MTGRTVVIRDRSEVARALRRGVATLAVVAALTWLLPDSEARDRSAPSWLWWVLLLALVVGLTWRGVVRAGVLHLAEDGVRCHGRSYSW